MWLHNITKKGLEISFESFIRGGELGTCTSRDNLTNEAAKKTAIVFQYTKQNKKVHPSLKDLVKHHLFSLIYLLASRKRGGE